MRSLGSFSRSILRNMRKFVVPIGFKSDFFSGIPKIYGDINENKN